ncbi:MAG: MtaA/CmuA family methyltransferase [Anaerolineae bacterium]
MTEGRSREWMSPKRRFLAGLFGGRVDRAPVGSPTSVATLELMAATGAAFPEAHTDAEIMARLAAGGYTVLGYDCIMPVFSVVQEAAALGCAVDWGTLDRMPTVRSHPWQRAADVHVPQDLLEHPAITCVLDALRILRRGYGDRVALVGKAFGPWSLALHVVGMEPFLIGLLEDPADTRRLLDRLVDVTVRFGKAQIEAGADVLCVPDHVTGNLVSAAVYRDFVLPIHRELTQELGAPNVLHCCGNTLDRLEHFAVAGFDCYHFESAVDARRATRVVGGRMSLMGNVNNPTTLLQGRPEDVRREAAAAWEAGVQIIGPECAVPLTTPNANLRAISELAAELLLR